MAPHEDVLIIEPKRASNEIRLSNEIKRTPPFFRFSKEEHLRSGPFLPRANRKQADMR